MKCVLEIKILHTSSNCDVNCFHHIKNKEKHWINDSGMCIFGHYSSLDLESTRACYYYSWPRGIDNGAAGAATVAQIIWLVVVVIQKWRTFSPPQTKFSLPLWMKFELIIAWQITSGVRGHGLMIFMPKLLYFLIYNITINILMILRVNP